MKVFVPLIIFISDQVVKESVERAEGLDKDRKIGPLVLHRVHNSGAFLNFGERHPGIVAAASLFLSVFSTIWYLRSIVSGELSAIRASRAAESEGAGPGSVRRLMDTIGHRLDILSQGLVLGGGWSNTFDRIRRGYVVDYIKAGHRDVYYNIGDVGIVTGAVLSILSLLFKRK